MKKILLTLALAVAGLTATYAQHGTKDKLTPEQKAEKSTVKLQKELSLTADQKQKVYAIELDKFKKSEEWHKKNKDARKAMKDQHEIVKNETDTKLNQVLTADQKKKLDAIKAEHKEKIGDHKGHKRAAKAA